jgi:hypothetical protein
VAHNRSRMAAGSRSSATTRVKPPEHMLVCGTEQDGEVTNRPEVCLDLPAFPLDGGLFDLEACEDLPPECVRPQDRLG